MSKARTVCYLQEFRVPKHSASNVISSGGVCGIIWTKDVNTLRERSVGKGLREMMTPVP